MKKALFIIAVVAAFGLAGCQPKATNKDGNQPQEAIAEQPEENQEIGKCILYQGDGKLIFYDLDAQTTRLRVDENGVVVGFVNTPDGKIYYNVEENGSLLLKSLELKTNAEPVTLVDWGINVESESEYGPTPYGKMYLNMDGNQIGLETDKMYYAGSYFFNYAVYDIASGNIKTYEMYRMGEDMPEDVPCYIDFQMGDAGNDQGEPTGIDYSQFVDEEGYLYYLGFPEVNGMHPCLNDKIDYQQYVAFGPGESDFTADLISLDPEGKRALVFFNGVMGDGIIGIYNVSTLDGKEQYVLPGSCDESHPQWLEDGSLVYVNYDDEPALYMMKPDGTLRKIGNAIDFAVLP